PLALQPRAPPTPVAEQVHERQRHREGDEHDQEDADRYPPTCHDRPRQRRSRLRPGGRHRRRAASGLEVTAAPKGLARVVHSRSGWRWALPGGASGPLSGHNRRGLGTTLLPLLVLLLVFLLGRGLGRPGRLFGLFGLLRRFGLLFLLGLLGGLGLGRGL